MKPFMDEELLLSGPTASELYHGVRGVRARVKNKAEISGAAFQTLEQEIEIRRAL